MKEMTESTKRLVEECNDLMIRFKSGDEGAYNELYHTTLTYVYNVIKQKGLTNEDVEDISQEVYLKIYTNAKSLEDTKSTLRWIKTIAVNTANDHFKKKGVIHETTFETEDSFLMFEESDLIAPIEMPEDAFEKKETRELLNSFINELPETQQICAKERFFNELQLKEIAEKYGIPEGTVKTNTFKARNNLQNKIIVYSKKYGVKLCAIPIFTLFFGLYSEKASAAEIPAKASANILAVINKTLGSSVLKSVSHAGTKGIITKIAALGTKKVAAIVIGAVAVAGVTTGVVVNADNNKEETAIVAESMSKIKEVEETTDPEATTVNETVNNEETTVSKEDTKETTLTEESTTSEEVLHLINGDYTPSELIELSKQMLKGKVWVNDMTISGAADLLAMRVDSPRITLGNQSYIYSVALQEDYCDFNSSAKEIYKKGIRDNDPNYVEVKEVNGIELYYITDVIYGESKYKTGDWYHDHVTMWENVQFIETPFEYNGNTYIVTEFIV